jgi:hypothetical protein
MIFLFMDSLVVNMCKMDLHVEKRVEGEDLETYFKDYLH